MLRDTNANDPTENDLSNILTKDKSLLDSLTARLPLVLYQFLRYPDGRSVFLYVSSALDAIFEMTPAELMENDRALSKRIHPEDKSRVDASINKSLQSLIIWDCEFRVMLPQKGIRWVRGIACPEIRRDGSILSNGYFEDVTERRNANDWIRYLNTALMNISESVVISDMSSKIIYANHQVKELHGYEPDEILGKPADMMTVNPPGEEELHVLYKTLDEGRTYTGTSLSRRKDGSTFLCEYSLTPIHGDAYASCIGVQRDITERTRYLKALKESNERFVQLTQHSRAIAWETDRNGVFTYISGAVQNIFGYLPEELVSKGTVYDLIIPSEREKVKKSFRLALKTRKSFMDLKCTFLDKSGNPVYLTINGLPKFNEEKSLVSYRGLAIDMTEKVKMKQRLSDEEERYKTTLLSVGEGIISTDCDELITVMNPLAETMTGWSQGEAAGKPLTEVLRIFDEQTGAPCNDPAKVVLKTAASYQPSFQTVLASKSGEEFPVAVIAAPIKNTAGKISGVVLVLKDFTEYRERQKQIEFLSYHDYLTGLYNRRYFEGAMKKIDTRSNLPLTVMMLDVNGLKLTNDAFGHSLGDTLLKTVADILRKICRASDIVARVGGDEFAILLPQTDAAMAEKVRERILQEALKTKFDTVIVSLAVGYSVKASLLDRLEDVFTQADKLMYKEKFNQGKTMRDQTIDTILQSINARFEEEQTHTERVSQYCFAIAGALNWGPEEKNVMKIAGLLHDIGKIVIPAELLNKAGRLTDAEFDIIKAHTETGYQILKSVDEYITISRYVLHHHERWDGTGYPAGLKGDEIPIQSRIISVADAFEAMTAKRVYQKTKTADEAKAELMRCSGTQFDPEIVKKFLESVLGD